MIVTITGAFRNVGDHLIGHRARILLKKYVDSEIVNINRNHIGDYEYRIMNEADAVILCGGPAYQESIYPKVYPLNLDRIKRPVIPMGLGWKSGLDQSPEKFDFTPEAKKFVQSVHSNISLSSVRDILTEQVIRNNGIDNVLMTGCPAWYDPEYFDKDYKFIKEIKQVNVSMPAKYHPQIPLLLSYLKTKFPDAKYIATFHHGFWTQISRTGLWSSVNFLKMAFIAILKLYSIKDLSKEIDKLSIYDEPQSLHIGYRVHAHLYCLSHKKDSVLINEDVRGRGQAESLNLRSFDISDMSIDEKLDEYFNNHVKTEGAEIRAALSKIEETFLVMQKFLESIKTNKV